MFRIACIALFASILVCAGCKTVPQTRNEQVTLVEQADITANQAAKQNPDVKYYMDRSPAFAVFPTMGKGGFVFGGGYGRGVLYENGHFAGYCDAAQLTVGAQIGGQSYTEFVFLENAEAIARFKAGQVALNAQVAAVAANAAAAERARYQEGVAVIILDAQGLMAEAAVGGQEFHFAPATRP